MKTEIIINQEIKLNNLPCRLFINHYNENQYELSVFYNNEIYRAITNQVEAVSWALNKYNSRSQEIAEGLVNIVKLNNALQLIF